MVLASAIAVTAFAQAPAPVNAPAASQSAATPPVADPAPAAPVDAAAPQVTDSATAGTPVIASAALPRDLSPWGMFLNADIVVKVVMVGLVFRLARHLDGVARQESGIVEGDAQRTRGARGAQRGALAR